MTTHNACEFPAVNSSQDDLKEILSSSKTIAVVGLSDNPERDSYIVAEYLQGKGYRIIPVNPSRDEILGEKSYPDLLSIPEPVDIVDIFRKPEAIPEIVDQAISIKAKTVWMQLGLAHNESARKAEEMGLKVVQSKCIKVEHSRIF